MIWTKVEQSSQPGNATVHANQRMSVSKFFVGLATFLTASLLGVWVQKHHIRVPCWVRYLHLCPSFLGGWMSVLINSVRDLRQHWRNWKRSSLEVTQQPQEGCNCLGIIYESAEAHSSSKACESSLGRGVGDHAEQNSDRCPGQQHQESGYRNAIRGCEYHGAKHAEGHDQKQTTPQNAKTTGWPSPRIATHERKSRERENQ